MNLNAKRTLNINLYRLISILVSFILFSNILFSRAIEYSGFGGKPAFPREDNPRTESIFVHTVNPGEIVEEGVRVVNNTNETKTFVVYAADYTRSTDGGFACRQYSQDKNGVGSWINLETEEITVDSMSEETIPFEIAIPEDVEVGEHNGCILIQEKKPSSEAAGISISIRTGLRVAITIPGEIIRKLSLSNILVIRKALDKINLNLSVKNTGNVSIDTDVRVGVYNLFGKEIITFGGQYPIFRNDEATYNYNVKSPTFGSIYKAKGVVTYDGNAGTEIGNEVYANPITIETRPVYFLVYPTLKGIAIILISVFALIFLLLKTFIRRKRKKWIMNNWVQYKAKRNDDINSLSEKYDVNWKILAKTNKLKEPYIIKSGDILKVPPKAKETEDKKSVKKSDGTKNSRNVKTRNSLKENTKTGGKSKPKSSSKPKPVVKKDPSTEPKVDEVSSIV
ncbi:LysM peptidoglycan-binding domain-containing protein [Patescibacteria group bacterium]|nr:LysM peptidoglycan-binding domain-containing protein [Patescibacteria group bacterium]